MAATLCRQFAGALQGLDARSVPPEVLHAARRALLDALGAALAGCGSEEVQGTLRACTAASQGDPERPGGSVPVWGTGQTLSAAHAALVNGTAVHAREVDDFGGCGHSGAVVVPAALAAAALHDVSGTELLLAVLAGYEAANRVIRLAGGYAEHNAQGWHGTGTCGVFGAAAAAARVLRLDAEAFTHALALAGTYTGGLWCFLADGAMSKRLHAGKAAEGGTMAALLAQQGLTGPTHLFEPGTWGSFIALYAPAGKADPGALLQDFGQAFRIFDSGFKPYACCRGCHGPLDALLALCEQHGLTAADVVRVTVHAPEQTARQLGKQEVANILDAQMSLPYSIAVALRFGRADLAHFQPPHLGDPALAALARKVQVVGDAARVTGSAPEVVLHLQDGKQVAATVEHAKGEHAHPLSDAELQAKFFALATLHVSRERAQQLHDLVWGLDRAASVRPLLAALRS
jgi:2-methylcitrate dehydratase PrpD